MLFVFSSLLSPFFILFSAINSNQVTNTIQMKLSAFSSSNPKSPQPIASSLKQKKSVPISGHPYLYFNINSWLIIDSLFIYCASGTFTDYLGNAYIPMIILSVLLSAATFSFVSLCIPADFYFSLMFYSTIIMFICTIIECFPVPSFLFFALRCILSIVRVPCFLFILHNAVFHNLKNSSSFINSYLWSLFFGFFYSFLFGYLIGEYLIWNIYYIILAPFCLIYMLILYVIYIKQSKYIFNQQLYSFFSFHREHTTQSLNESIIHPNDASLIVYSFSTATVKENVSSLTQKNTLYSILSTSFLYCFFMLFFYYYPIAFDKIHRICSLKCTHSILLSSFLVSILLCIFLTLFSSF